MKKFSLSLALLFIMVLSVLAQAEKDIDQLNEQAESMLNQNPKQSLVAATKNRATAESAGYKKGMAKAIAIMGVANYKIDEYAKAKMLISEAATINEQISDSSNLAFCKYWLGNLELNQGQYSVAFDLYQVADSISVKIGDKKNLARSLDGQASIYEALGEDARALDMYQKALEIAKQDNFKVWYPSVISSLGNLAFKKGNFDEAIKKYNEAVQTSDEVGNLNNKANCYQQLATIYYEKKDSKEAMKYIQNAMTLFQKTGSESSFSRSRVLMATILVSDGNYDLAIEMAKMSLDEGKRTHEIDLQVSAAEILYYAYLRKGDKGKALEYHILFHDLTEANHDEDMAKRLAKMDLESNFKKEREIAKAEQAKRDTEMNAKLGQQNLVKKVSFIGIFLVSIIAGLAIFAFLQKRGDSRLIATEKKRTDELLRNILPAEIAAEIKQGEYKVNNQATVLFADVKSITGAGQSSASLQAELDQYFKTFDEIIAKHRIEKVKTIGDAYLCVSSLPVDDKDNAVNVVMAAVEMQQFVDKAKRDQNAVFFDISIGINTGPLIAGIVGIRKLSHDVWGDTINVAARMEQHGEEGKINISSQTFELVKDKFNCTYRGKVETGNREKIDMYYVDSSIA
ncbi:MAG: hypothetical protein JWO06_3378 [Bacteroidota bacterium]|nr:hypothetical protein [Bacteroidota bacterium]